MTFANIKKLSPREQALVVVSVLLDGREAENYIAHDQVNGKALAVFAAELSKYPPDVRMSLAGTILRQAIEDLGSIK